MLLKYFREYKAKPTGIADVLPWSSYVDLPLGVMATEPDEGVMTTFALTPLDLAGLPEATAGIVKLRINEAFKWFPEDWAFWLYTRRRPVLDYSETAWSHPIEALVDAEQRAQLTAPGARWTSETYLTLWQRTPRPITTFVRSLFFEGLPSAPGVDDQQFLTGFEAGVRRCVTILSSAVARIERLDATAQARYLKSLVSIYDQPVELPTPPVNLGAYLGDSRLTPAIVPILGPIGRDGRPTRGGVYLCCLSLSDDWPLKSRVGILRDLKRLAVPYEECVRWKPMGRAMAEKVTTKAQINYLSSSKSMRAQVHEFLTKQQTQGMNTHVEKRATDADAARDETLSNQYALGRFTMAWLMRHPQLHVAEAWLNELRDVLHRHGCIPIDTDLDATEVFLGMLPGNLRPNVEQHKVTSQNFGDLGAWHHAWEGVSWNAHLGVPALCQATTDGTTRFGVDFHTGREASANVLQVGSFGVGKSTLNNFFALQARRRPDTRVIIIDSGGSARATTYCVGGAYLDILRGDLPQQLFAHFDSDDPRELAAIQRWLKNRIVEAGVTWHPDMSVFLEGGFRVLREHPQRPRMLKEFLDILSRHGSAIGRLATAQGNERSKRLALAAPEIQDALRPYAQGGMYGYLVDAPVDRLDFGPWTTLEVGELLRHPDLHPAVLEILYERMRRIRTGAPVFVQYNEASHIFRSQVWIDQLAKDMPDWRRENQYALFSSQSISHFEGNPLTPFLLESCKTHMFLPNPEAMKDKVLPLYLGMQLHPEEVEQFIAMAPAPGSFYLVRPEGRRLVDLRLTPIQRAICGMNRQEDHQAMDAILARHDVGEFPVHWLRHCGHPDAAAWVERELSRGQAPATVDALLEVS